MSKHFWSVSTGSNLTPVYATKQIIVNNKLSNDESVHNLNEWPLLISMYRNHPDTCVRD